MVSSYEEKASLSGGRVPSFGALKIQFAETVSMKPTKARIITEIKIQPARISIELPREKTSGMYERSGGIFARSPPFCLNGFTRYLNERDQIACCRSSSAGCYLV